MMIKVINNLLMVSIFIVLYLVATTLPVHAYDPPEKFTFDGYLQAEYAYNTRDSNRWFKCRNVLNLEFSYDFSPSWKGFVQTRFVYDAAFDFADSRGIKGRKNMANEKL